MCLLLDRLANKSVAIGRLRAVYGAAISVAAGFLGMTKEPVERYNIERFFVMHEYMREVRWHALRRPSLAFSRLLSPSLVAPAAHGH